MFNCALQFIKTICFGHSCGSSQSLVQQEYKQYTSDYVENE